MPRTRASTSSTGRSGRPAPSTIRPTGSGLTWGFTAELNQPHWAARAGYFLVGNEPNANTFDMNLFARGGYVGELEMRFKPYGRPGRSELGNWLTSTFAGSYNQAVALANADPA